MGISRVTQIETMERATPNNIRLEQLKWPRQRPKSILRAGWHFSEKSAGWLRRGAHNHFRMKLAALVIQWLVDSQLVL